MKEDVPVFNLFVLRSTDLQRMVRFYEGIGLEWALESHGDGPQHFAADDGGFVFELYPLAEGQIPTTSVRLGFQVEDIAAVVSRLRALEFEVPNLPGDSPWGRRIVVKDPEGHTVELTEKVMDQSLP